MEQNKLWILRRITETLIIEIISSLMIYILVIKEIIPSTNFGYVFGFGASALIFLTLNYFVLYNHFWILRFNTKKYLIINFSILTFLALLSLAGLQFLPNNIYTALFGYTKPFRLIFDMSALESALLFWILYSILIVFVILKVRFFDRKYKEKRERYFHRHAFEDLEINFMED